MPPNIFICGFLGGFLVSIIPYVEGLKNIQPEKDTKKSNESMNFWKYVQKTFNTRGFFHCVFWGLFGVVLVYVIDPKESLYAIYLGMTAYPTFSKFYAAFHPPNKHT